MRALLTATAFLLASVGHADEIVLKDGRVIEWSTLRDAGDMLEVVTAEGTTLSVPKSDVDRVKLAQPAPVLTGATFEFDRKRRFRAVDLSRAFDPKKASHGSLSVSSRGIEINGTAAMIHSKFPSTFTPPEEYDLTMTVQRLRGMDEFAVGIVGGGKQVTVIFDRERASYMNVEGLPNKLGALFEENGKPRQITFMVRKEGLVIRVDGKDYYSVEGWEKASLHRLMGVPDPSVLFLVTLNSGFRISKMALTAPLD